MIEKTLPSLKKLTNEYLGQFRNNKLRGGINFERLSENLWHFKTTLAQPLLNWKFGVGNYSIFLMSLFTAIFVIFITFGENQNRIKKLIYPFLGLGLVIWTFYYQASLFLN